MNNANDVQRIRKAFRDWTNDCPPMSATVDVERRAYANDVGPEAARAWSRFDVYARDAGRLLVDMPEQARAAGVTQATLDIENPRQRWLVAVAESMGALVTFGDITREDDIDNIGEASIQLLDRMTPSEAAATPDDEWLAIETAAARLDVSKRTIHRWLEDGLPSDGEGKTRRIRASELHRWHNSPRQ